MHVCYIHSCHMHEKHQNFTWNMYVNIRTCTLRRSYRSMFSHGTCTCTVFRAGQTDRQTDNGVATVGHWLHRQPLWPHHPPSWWLKRLMHSNQTIITLIERSNTLLKQSVAQTVPHQCCESGYATADRQTDRQTNLHSRTMRYWIDQRIKIKSR